MPFPLSPSRQTMVVTRCYSELLCVEAEHMKEIYEVCVCMCVCAFMHVCACVCVLGPWGDAVGSAVEPKWIADG